MRRTNAVDLSVYQNNVDYSVLKDKAKYVVIKASQGGSLDGTGSPFTDPMMATHAKGCIDSNIPFSFYHFARFRNKVEAKNEAKYFLDAILPYRQYLTYVYLDCEVYNIPGMKDLSKKDLTDLVLVFLDECKKYGYLPALYTNPDHWMYKLENGRINYPLWVAYHASDDPMYENEIMWQHSVGKINGVPGKCDLNYCKIPEEQLAIQSLANKGFIVSPVYWINKLPEIKYLDGLMKNADMMLYEYLPNQEGVNLDNSLKFLTAAGVMMSPDYWRIQANKHKFVKSLILNLGHGKTYT